jgi:hypothetical protein
MHTKQKGDITTAKVMTHLLALGKTVLIPWGDNQRYDLVIDEGNHFKRVQCKTGRLINGCIAFNTSSTGNPNAPYRNSYLGQADLFGVFSPELDKCYLVPVEQVSVVEARLRIEPTKNNQAKGVLWACTFEIK